MLADGRVAGDVMRIRVRVYFDSVHINNLVVFVYIKPKLVERLRAHGRPKKLRVDTEIFVFETLFVVL